MVYPRLGCTVDAPPATACYRVLAWCPGMRTHTIHLWLQPALLRLQAGCDAQQMYGNDSAVAEALQHAYSRLGLLTVYSGRVRGRAEALTASASSTSARLFVLP
jgi:hypothetical protein